jgi:heme/copper-type cytochrome/quinol oxidase subunit 2
MLHLWLIPALIVLAVVVSIFYLVVRFRGGSGVRSEGRTVHHQQTQEDDLPPS